MAAPVATQRVLVGVSAAIDVTFLDQNGEAAAAVGAVTVDAVNGAGTTIVTGGTTSNPSTGVYRYALAAQTQLDLLTFTWKDGGIIRTSSVVDVAGGYYFQVNGSDPTRCARAFDDSITPALASDTRVQDVRREVEDECEWITKRAFVPRYRREVRVGDGTGVLRTGIRDIRTVRTVRIYNSDGTTSTVLTAAQLAALRVSAYGTLTRIDGDTWPIGQSIAVEVEHGQNRPPSDLLHATLTRLRYRLKMETSGIPDRATTFVMADAGAFVLPTPGRYGFDTGIPEVDAVYQRYRKRPTATSVAMA